MLIRPETPSDIDAIRAVHDAAIGQADEGLVVDRLRGTADRIEGGSLVAVEMAGRWSGTCCSAAARWPRAAPNTRCEWSARVAELPGSQRRGIGSALMRSAIALAVERGVPLLLLLGHADYYSRFGFEPARRLGIEPPQPWPDAAWQALRLPGWTPDLRGVARYAPAFGVG